MGILVFLVFLGISLVGRFIKAQKGQQEQQWPGPVAKTPGMPRETPKTTWAPPAPPQQQPRRQQPQAQLQPRKEATKTLVSREGEGSEGMWSGTEGPARSERVRAEMDRFARDSEQMEHRTLAELSHDIAGSELEQLSDEVYRPEDEAPTVTESERTAWNLQSAIASKDSLAQAVILSEVLGKPRALRKGHRAW